MNWLTKHFNKPAGQADASRGVRDTPSDKRAELLEKARQFGVDTKNKLTRDIQREIATHERVQQQAKKFLGDYLQSKDARNQHQEPPPEARKITEETTTLQISSPASSAGPRGGRRPAITGEWMEDVDFCDGTIADIWVRNVRPPE